jgi:nucleoid DNA-binding protein
VALEDSSTPDDTPVRLDHVDLYYSYFGITWSDAKSESGWLALMPDGRVLFYEGRRPRLDRPPRFSAPDVTRLRVKRFLNHLRFDEDERIVRFTGRSDPKAEGVDSFGELVESVGGVFDNRLVEAAGLAIQGGGVSWESLTNAGGKQRRRAAQAFWAQAAQAPAVQAKQRSATRSSVSAKTAGAAVAVPPTASPEFAAALADRMGASAEDAETAATAVFEAITRALAAGDEVMLAGFGAFTPSVRDGGGAVRFRGYAALKAALETG